jgi:hypothetical protein
MLHHAFINWKDLLYIGGQTYGTYIDAFQACSRLHSHPQDFYTDPDDEDDGVDIDSESEEDLALRINLIRTIHLLILRPLLAGDHGRISHLWTLGKILVPGR